MPSYSYHCTCGHKKPDQFMSMDQSAYRPKCKCGKVMERDFEREFKGNKSFQSACWPNLSDALGVHPDQIPEAREEAIKLGVPTEFTNDGRAILTSPQHRKKYAEAHGFYDKNGGFGDPQTGKCRREE